MPDTYLRSMLDTAFKYMQKFSRDLSIVGKSMDTEVRAPVRKGVVRIEFIDKPVVRYLVHAVPARIMIEAACYEARLPYIALKVEDGEFSEARMPSLSGEGYHRLGDPIAGIAQASSIMRMGSYVVSSKSVELKNFVEDIFENVRRIGEEELKQEIKLLTKEATKHKEFLDVELMILFSKEDVLSLYYRESKEPYLAINISHSLSEDEAALFPVLTFNGKDVSVVKDAKDLVDNVTDLLNKLNVDTLFKDLQEVIHQFIEEYVKALIVIKRRTL